ncbi:MerR family transcriptional regulator [Streptomyces sp. SL13]|jgi:DNA-binding transcriptional MerR regulator|uniref:MerR family transcriptional regulator n=1 Tax=Streptantibioticus silvisoli TaxID=2705255 RepID=A0AA90HAG1_9ACTN|nr:MerR family transcriptional regulator [Streptantibioticus silvisoli]MDI5973823.1 MerR family transcriptional regulator [Streptantibioticus silvisoli]
MLSIGDFARYGRVSVRMLRHYDAIGLLRPARVDPVTGYRGYEAAQLARLNRVIALKDLGFSLQQVREIVDGEVGAGELRGMLRLRRAELETALAEAGARLTRVEARLRTIESEGVMDTDDVVVKRIAAVRVAELTGRAAGYRPQDIGPVAGPLFDALCRELDAAGVTPAGPGIAYYEDVPGGEEEIVVHAALPVAVDGRAAWPFAVVDLPEIAAAATVVHHGPMDDVLTTMQTLGRWMDVNGRSSAGYPRELYLDCPPDRTRWVTELQEPLRQG